MKHSAKKRRKLAKRQRAKYAVRAAETPRRGIVLRVLDAVRRSHFVRGAQTLTLFPQLPEVDISVRAQREDLAQIWRDVGGYFWTAYGEETRRVRMHERQE